MTLALVYGVEDFRVDEKTQEFRKKYPSLKVLDGEIVAEEQILLSLQSTGLFSTQRYCEIRNAPWFLDDVEESSVDIVTSTLSGLQKEECVLFSQYGNISARNKLFQFIKKNGEVSHYAELPPWSTAERISFLEERVQKLGKQIAPDAAEYIGGLGTFSLRQLASEAEKLATAVHPEKTITLSITQSLVAPGAAYAWQLADHVLQKNVRGALETLRTITSSGETGYTIIPVLAKQFRMLHKHLLGIPLGSAVTRGTEWRIRKAAPRFSKALVEKILCRIVRVDEQMKRSMPTPAPLLESLVVFATTSS